MQLADVDRLVTDALDAAAGGRAGAIGLAGPRGAGKTWWLDRVAGHADRRCFMILRARAGHDDHEVPFGALAAVLGPARDRVDSAEWAPLRPVLELDHRRVDATDVKIAAFRLLCALAESQPVCLLLDDTHWFDAASVDVLGFVARRAAADAIAIVTTSLDDRSAIAGVTVRLDPVPLDTIERMLVDAGLDDRAASRCAEASLGNPGMARALADGLTEAQRRGSAPVSVLPRPSGQLVDELQARLRSYGETVCRSLVAAAAEPTGDVTAVRAALAALGEPADGLDEAESLGLIEVVGSRFAFTDPWIQPVAYHLVAPASRRAAHLALAAWFATADAAAQRAWHLAAGSVGPDAAVADALELVAADAARRGGLASAAVTSERAAEFSVTSVDRERNVLAAMRWWMEVGAADPVRRLIRAIDPVTPDGAVAIAEGSEFLDGVRVMVVWDGDIGCGWWPRRRAERLAIAVDLEQGDHRSVHERLGAAASIGEAERALTSARAHRQAGRTREAREASTTASVLLDGSSVFAARVATLVAADLDILQGRGADATAAIHSATAWPAGLRDWAATLAARARLQSDPDRAAVDEVDAFAAHGSGALRDVHEAICDGVLGRRPEPLEYAVELADRHAWPVEAGEARLWLAELQPAGERAHSITLARAALQRSGVRAWDLRLASLADEPAVQKQRRPDPGLAALSQAEFRVAEAVASGLTNRQVAAELIISVKTVDFHLQQMYRKLGIRSRTELAVRMTNFENGPGGAAR